MHPRVIEVIYTGHVRATEPCVHDATLYNKGDVFEVTNQRLTFVVKNDAVIDGVQQFKVLASDPFERVHVTGWDDVPAGAPGGFVRVGDGMPRRRALCEVLASPEAQLL